MTEDIQKACEIMQAGGIILYPTDTIWGIGCDATNEKAVQKVYELKKRTDNLPIRPQLPAERRMPVVALFDHEQQHVGEIDHQ